MLRVVLFLHTQAERGNVPPQPSETLPQRFIRRTAQGARYIGRQTGRGAWYMVKQTGRSIDYISRALVASGKRMLPRRTPFLNVLTRYTDAVVNATVGYVFGPSAQPEKEAKGVPSAPAQQPTKIQIQKVPNGFYDEMSKQIYLSYATKPMIFSLRGGQVPQKLSQFLGRKVLGPNDMDQGTPKRTSAAALVFVNHTGNRATGILDSIAYMFRGGVIILLYDNEQHQNLAHAFRMNYSRSTSQPSVSSPAPIPAPPKNKGLVSKRLIPVSSLTTLPAASKPSPHRRESKKISQAGISKVEEEEEKFLEQVRRQEEEDERFEDAAREHEKTLPQPLPDVEEEEEYNEEEEAEVQRILDTMENEPDDEYLQQEQKEDEHLLELGQEYDDLHAAEIATSLEDAFAQIEADRKRTAEVEASEKEKEREQKLLAEIDSEVKELAQAAAEAAAEAKAVGDAKLAKEIIARREAEKTESKSKMELRADEALKKFNDNKDGLLYACPAGVNPCYDLSRIATRLLQKEKTNVIFASVEGTDTKSIYESITKTKPWSALIPHKTSTINHASGIVKGKRHTWYSARLNNAFEKEMNNILIIPSADTAIFSYPEIIKLAKQREASVKIIIGVNHFFLFDERQLLGLVHYGLHGGEGKFDGEKELQDLKSNLVIFTNHAYDKDVPSITVGTNPLVSADKFVDDWSDPDTSGAWAYYTTPGRVWTDFLSDLLEEVEEPLDIITGTEDAISFEKLKNEVQSKREERVDQKMDWKVMSFAKWWKQQKSLSLRTTQPRQAIVLDCSNEWQMAELIYWYQTSSIVLICKDGNDDQRAMSVLKRLKRYNSLIKENKTTAQLLADPVASGLR